MKGSPKAEQELMTILWSLGMADDLQKLVRFIYPWGKAGTPLADHKGPRRWQATYLDDVSQHRRDQRERIAKGMTPTLWKHATASGRGPGKSALVAWLSHISMTCEIGGSVIVTANTEDQLKNITFSQIGHWMTLAINGHWFEKGALNVSLAPWFRAIVEQQLKINCTQYQIFGKLWSEENPDAFAGAHNPLGMRVLMDEASGIPNAIFNVAEGFFTEPALHRYWDIFSNPRRPSGAFYDCFHDIDSDGKLSTDWRRLQIDSRTVEGLDHANFEKQIAKHGIDSYTIRVEVLGQFPRQGDAQFIGNDVVQMAMERREDQVVPDPGAPLMLGIDVARWGDDWNVCRFRQGKDARSIPPQKWQGLELDVTADRIAKLIDEYQPDGVCIDSGMGAGVIVMLRKAGYRIHEIGFGFGAIDKQWGNKGTEMYAAIRDWLPGALLDKDPLLFKDLTARDFRYGTGKQNGQRFLIEKDVFKKLVGRSPDDGDALALTFGVNVARRDRTSNRHQRNTMAQGLDYPLFG